MSHFGVELQAIDRKRRMADGGQGAGCRLGKRCKIGGDLVDLIAVAHPHLGRRRHSAKQWVCGGDLAGSTAVFPRRRLADPPTEGVAGQLHPVTDAEDRDAETEQPWITSRRPLLVHTRRPAGEDDPPRSHVANAVCREVVPNDLAEDVLLAHPSGDELGVLRAEVEDDDPLGTGRGGLGGFGPVGVLRHGWGPHGAGAEKPDSIGLRPAVVPTGLEIHGSAPSGGLQTSRRPRCRRPEPSTIGARPDAHSSPPEEFRCSRC